MPERKSEATTREVRVFDSEFLEWFSRTGPLTVAAFWAPASMALIVAGLLLVHRSPGQLAVTIVGVLLLWTLFEYFFHRVLFHLSARLPGGERFAFVLHGCHHVDPSDASRNVMPLVVTIPVVVVLMTVTAQFFVLADCLLPFGIFTLGYLGYDLVHYSCHQVAMPGRLGRYLKRHHSLHHFRDSETNFSVTFPLWDKVFGTYG